MIFVNKLAENDITLKNLPVRRMIFDRIVDDKRRKTKDPGKLVQFFKP